MKKILILLSLICLSVSAKINAQNMPLDTLNYLKQNFEINKANYIGHPFSKLLNDMTAIQPKTVWSDSPHRNKNIRKSSRFKFTYKELSFHNVITLYIEWETPLPTQETKVLSIANQYYFTNQEKAYYGNKIVKDIKVYR